jgi:nucleotide-binding universal stress UspA family protein
MSRKRRTRNGGVHMIPEIKKILYATDLSKNSSYAFVYAIDMATRHNAGIVILHTVEAGHPISYAGARIGAMVEEGRRKEQETDLEEIRKGLESFCGKMEAHICHPCLALVSKIIVSQGYPVEEILKTADEERCDAIVLGTHGKGFLKHTFLGSVAVSLLERTRKPVFVIPLPAEKTTFDWDSI